MGFLLDGTWSMATDPQNVGREQGWPSAPVPDARPIQVPGILQQLFPGYHGIVWYWREFDVPANPPLAELLIATAITENIPYTIEPLPRGTGTDADGIAVAGTGTAVAVVSFPNRYMHSPNEVCSLADLEASARLLAATIRAITRTTDFTPR